MKLEKKHWVIIGVVIVAVIAIWYFFLRKKKAESGYKTTVMNTPVKSKPSPLNTGVVAAGCERGYHTCKSHGCCKDGRESPT
jgi:uncharacterized membrane protein